jgi:hypothetical protein
MTPAHCCVDCGRPALISDDRCYKCMIAHWDRVMALGGHSIVTGAMYAEALASVALDKPVDKKDDE